MASLLCNRVVSVVSLTRMITRSTNIKNLFYDKKASQRFLASISSRNFSNGVTRKDPEKLTEANIEGQKNNGVLKEEETTKDDPYAPFPDGINPVTGEKGGPRGPEPTRYGDWERKGRCIDF